MISPPPFDTWFKPLTTHDSSRRWQGELASESVCRDRLIRIPTGLGKTEGVLSSWSYHRLLCADDRWPRRLIWCLPMRVLVEQTEQVAQALVARMPAEHRPDVHVLMGGEDLGEWFLHPERLAILIGTQDMLLSRALNRGYGSARARWPVEFGLLNQDALWVMDEVQLMDVGLATSAQLQAFRGHDHSKSIRPCYTWWMSATLQPDWLKSVDTIEQHTAWVHEPCRVPTEHRQGGLWDIPKTLSVATIGREEKKEFAQSVLTAHAAVEPGSHGKITLVVCNTVQRACETFDALQAAGRKSGIELVHSRFRQAERTNWRQNFLSRTACTSEVDRIVVATQVVEAGVDISAGCLITELAPWPSLVQRFGRCARYGGSGRVIVVDRGRDEKSASPYALDELESAWSFLGSLTDVGIATLESHEESLSSEGRARLYPYSPTHLLLRREYDELFDTTPDLTGADLDISRFIRSGTERDLQVFWIDLSKDEKPSPDRRPQRQELCTVPFLQARDWLCGKGTKENPKPKLRGGKRAWIWDWLAGEWVVANRSSLVPGRIVCVAAECGGYRIDRGFDADANATVPAVPAPAPSEETRALIQSDNQQDAENLSFSEWKTIACHSQEVSDIVQTFARQLSISDQIEKVLALAATWHDIGKSHPAFQGMLRSDERPLRQDLAKGPSSCWTRPPVTYRFADNSDTRPAFRHELASALALFAVLETFEPQHPALLGTWGEEMRLLGHLTTTSVTNSSVTPSVQKLLACSAEEFNLLTYLVASHHGKVRVALHPAPKDQDYRDRDQRGMPIRGVREGDRLPAVTLDVASEPIPELSLTLEPAALGLSFRTGESWRERCNQLLIQFGPAGLAFLESLLRAADVRASRLTTDDPILANQKSEAP